MKTLKIIIMMMLCIITNKGYAQSAECREFTNTITDFVSSFYSNPSHHSNTVIIQSKLPGLERDLEELYSDFAYSDLYTERQDAYYLKNALDLVKVTRFLTDVCAGYAGKGIEWKYVEDILNPIVSSFGWTIDRRFLTTDKIELYKYSYGSFKIVLAKNTLPKYSWGDYNAVNYKCYHIDPYTKKQSWFIQRIVHGGNYQVVWFHDDSNRDDKITKVTSRIGNNLE